MDDEIDLSKTSKQEPVFNPIPVAALWIGAFFVAIEAVLVGGAQGLWGGPQAVGWRAELIQSFGFSGPQFERMFAAETYSFEKLIRPFTHVVVANGWQEFLISMVFIVALGKYTAERLMPFPLIILAVFSGFAGALGFAAFLDIEAILAGAFPLAFGMLGFYTEREYWSAVRNKKPRWTAFRIAGFVITIDIVLSYITGQPEFWVARVSALVFGFFFGLFVSSEGCFSWASAKRKVSKAW